MASWSLTPSVRTVRSMSGVAIFTPSLTGACRPNMSTTTTCTKGRGRCTHWRQHTTRVCSRHTVPRQTPAYHGIWQQGRTHVPPPPTHTHTLTHTHTHSHSHTHTHGHKLTDRHPTHARKSTPYPSSHPWAQAGRHTDTLRMHTRAHLPHHHPRAQADRHTTHAHYALHTTQAHKSTPYPPPRTHTPAPYLQDSSMPALLAAQSPGPCSPKPALTILTLSRISGSRSSAVGGSGSAVRYVASIRMGDPTGVFWKMFDSATLPPYCSCLKFRDLRCAD